MKPAKLILIFLLTLSLSLLALSGLDLLWFAHHGNRQPETVITIKPGSSLKKIARILAEHNLIGSQLRFKILNRVLQSSAALKAGEYEIAADATPLAIIATLRQGKSLQHKISFPEGFTLKQIENRLVAARVCTAAEFEKITTAAPELKKWQIPSANLEGYLFPSTYCYDRNTSCRELVTQMLDTGRQKFTALKAAAPTTNFNRHQILTLASIIQKEAGNLEEMPLIAAVFYNRLRRHQRLASDPTTIYGLGESFDGNLHRRDLKNPSPYNTYRHKGLPPGPICSPGASAIKAALNPAVSDYLFFVSRNNGSHQFSKTYAEHQQAVKKYQLGK